MTRKELLVLHTETCKKAFSIMEAKNHDYTGGSTDPFANFRATEILGVPAELGILTRCLDKFQRIRSFTVKGELKVKDESVNDAIEDVINYMILLKGVIASREELRSKADKVEEAPEPPQDVMDKIYESEGFVTPKEKRSCGECKHTELPSSEYPCYTCVTHSHWQPAFQEGPG